MDVGVQAEFNGWDESNEDFYKTPQTFIPRLTIEQTDLTFDDSSIGVYYA